MEDTLREDKKNYFLDKEESGLNPYSIGRYSTRFEAGSEYADADGLNPYSIGRYSTRANYRNRKNPMN